jgi:hypothetical protein
MPWAICDDPHEIAGLEKTREKKVRIKKPLHSSSFAVFA